MISRTVATVSHYPSPPLPRVFKLYCNNERYNER